MIIFDKVYGETVNLDEGAAKVKNQPQPQPVCEVDVQKIFAMLHATAVLEANKLLEKEKGVVENTAANGNDPKKAIFHSAGEHMITARARDEGGRISREAATAALKKYVGIFCGEDVAKGLKDDEIIPLPEDNGHETVAQQDTKQEIEGKVSESLAFSMTFSQYLSESVPRWRMMFEYEGEDRGGSEPG